MTSKFKQLIHFENWKTSISQGKKNVLDRKAFSITQQHLWDVEPSMRIGEDSLTIKDWWENRIPVLYTGELSWNLPDKKQRLGLTAATAASCHHPFLHLNITVSLLHSGLRQARSELQGRKHTWSLRFGIVKIHTTESLKSSHPRVCPVHCS